MSRAEERALEAYPVSNRDVVQTHFIQTGFDEEGFEYYTRETIDDNLESRKKFIEGYEVAEKDTVAEVERWLKAEFHHRNCWNADEFCISLRTHFGIEK